tara:strand:+ start:2717 stop:2956 length:240 start_codon:yes stop_codon:yes gene_type:complete
MSSDTDLELLTRHGKLAEAAELAAIASRYLKAVYGIIIDIYNLPITKVEQTRLKRILVEGKGLSKQSNELIAKAIAKDT